MRERQSEEEVERPSEGDAMLVSCVRCETLHAPTRPLAFHPVCTACV